MDSPQISFKVHCFVVDDVDDSLVFPLQSNRDVDSCCVMMQLSTVCSIISGRKWSKLSQFFLFKNEDHMRQSTADTLCSQHIIIICTGFPNTRRDTCISQIAYSPHLRDNPVWAGSHPVQLVNKGNARDTIAIHLPINSQGLTLYPSHGTEDEDSSI